MSERPDDRSSNGSGGAQQREPDADRTGVITEAGEPVHSRPGDGRAGESEQAMPGGEQARGVPGGVPPWHRGPSGPGNPGAGGIDVAGPQHTSSQGGGQRSGEDAPTAVFATPTRGAADADPDAPTGYFQPVVEQPEEDRDHEPGPVSAEQPVFEHPTAARPASTRVRASRAPRRASLQLKRFDPWSVLKLSLVLSVAGFLAWMVAVGVLYGVLEGMGVWDQLNGTYSDLTSVTNPQAGGDLISAGRVFGVAALVGAINVVLVTAMATVGSFIYNVASDLAGGVELTLSERD